MAKAPAEEPAKLPNDKKAAYHRHLAIHILLAQQIKVLQDRSKANLKAATDAGIQGKQLVVTHKLAKEAPSKIAQHYAEQFEMLEFQGINLGSQFNIFGGVDVQTPKKGPDYYGAGLMAALDGKDGNPPKALKGPDQQRWLEGWNDGVAARVHGQEYLKNAEAILKAADNDGRPEPDDGQIDLEDAVEGATIRVGLSDFGPMAKLEDIELADLVLDAEEMLKAVRIEVVDADGRINILKNREGGAMGIQDASFEAPAAELAAQKARPSTVKATDPAPVDTKH